MTEATLWQSDSTSVFVASSLQEDSGLVVQRPELFCPLEEGGDAIHGIPLDFSLGWDDVDFVVLFCSDEWEESDSMLPMGVLSGLLLYESPEEEWGKEKKWHYVCKLLFSIVSIFLMPYVASGASVIIKHISVWFLQITFLKIEGVFG